MFPSFLSETSYHEDLHRRLVRNVGIVYHTASRHIPEARNFYFELLDKLKYYLRQIWSRQALSFS